MKKKLLLLFAITFFAVSLNAQNVSTLTGNTNGYFNGSLYASKFDRPWGLCMDENDNMYVTEIGNNTIRQISITGDNVTTLAGAGIYGFADGTGTSAKFYGPTDVCYGGNGNLYVADSNNNVIRKIEIATGTVTTFAGNASSVGNANGIGTAATFNGPRGICYDGNGNLFVADYFNSLIRKIVIATAEVTTLAGFSSGFANGIGAAALFNRPYGICYDGNRNLYVTDSWNYKIRKINIATAAVTTIAGSTQGFADATGSNAKFRTLTGLSTDGGNQLFVLDASKVRKVVISTTEVSTFSGSAPGLLDGSVSTALFSSPVGITKDSNGNLYIGDTNNHRIRKISDAFTLGTEQVDALKINIYPNPTEDFLKINLPKGASLKEIKIYNGLGQIVVKEAELTRDNLVNVSQLSKGIYILKLSTSEGIPQTFRLIKK